MKVSVEELRQTILGQLAKKFNSQDSNLIAEYLLWADMSGISTQGIIKMVGTEPLQNITPKYEIKVIRETKLSQLIDAGANPAPLAAQIATEAVIQKAKDHGIGIVGVKNTFSSNGAQGYYVEKIAKNDLIGVMCSRSPASTAGFGSIDPVFGTNPIGFGFPTIDDPLVFDTATSAMTFYGLVLAKARGESIPENMAIDSNGHPTTDPSEAMKGALLPFDHSYKGSGFGMVVEMLAGPLLGGAWIDNQTFEEEWGTVILAIDPELFVEIEDFKKNASDFITKIKSSRVQMQADGIRLPGEQATKKYRESLRSGFVEVDDVIYQQLSKAK